MQTARTLWSQGSLGPTQQGYSESGLPENSTCQRQYYQSYYHQGYQGNHEVIIRVIIRVIRVIKFTNIHSLSGPSQAYPALSGLLGLS